jgi:hypothetical protein
LDFFFQSGALWERRSQSQFGQRINKKLFNLLVFILINLEAQAGNK